MVNKCGSVGCVSMFRGLQYQLFTCQDLSPYAVVTACGLGTVIRVA